MTTPPRRIEPLTPQHRCSNFSCGKNWLDRYIRHHALNNQNLGYGRTYVAVRDDPSNRVDGYYTISMSSVVFQHLPPNIADRVPKYPMPVAHMGCLAVATDCQRQGLGELLLVSSITRMLSAAQIIAARAIEVKAIDEAAGKWYERYGFRPFLDNPLHLYLPMATAQSLVESLKI